MVKFKPELPKTREFHGGDLLAQALRHLGVEVSQTLSRVVCAFSTANWSEYSGVED